MLGLIVIIFYFFGVACWYASVRILMRAGIKSHQQMIYKLIRSKKSFYDRNPVGRILNRFSSDLGIVDNTLLDLSIVIIRLVVRASLSLIIVSFISYYLVIPCFILIIFFYCLGSYFNKGIVRLKQLESVTRSPIYSEFS